MPEISHILAADSIFWALMKNASLLIALAYVHSLLPTSEHRLGGLRQLGLGLLLGLIGITIITTSYPFRDGIIFDTRSILIGVTGLYFGLIPTVVVVLATGAFRLMQGGPAASIGLSVIVASGVIGLVWRHLRKPDLANISWRELIAFGFAVHLVMLAIFLRFPANHLIDVFSMVTIPVLGIYPPVTAVLGKLLSFRLQRTTHARLLRESEERFKLIFKGANDGWWDWDLTVNQLTYSPRWWEMLGMKPGERDSSPDLWRELMHPDDIDRVNDRFRQALESDVEKYEVEFRLRHREGHYISVISRGHIRRDGNGKALRVSGTNVDITERKALEQRIREADKMESLGRLAGGIAHDFNNMLGVIIGHADLASHRLASGQPVQDHLVQIREAADRSADLVRQLLTFARRQVVTPRVIDLNQSVDTTLSMLRRLIGGDISLQWHPGDELWPVKIDPVQMDQVLTNLVLNARDAIDDHGTITIRTWNSAADSQVCLEVGDTGSGMDPGTLKHVFEPFFTTKSIGQGTGLGLATVHGIVEQSGGTIEVTSKPGAGSTFLIRLPRQTPASPNSDAGQGVSDPGGNETILLVDDEPAILLLATQSLRLKGYQVLPVSKPMDALAIASQPEITIDLVISDLIMPGMNGRVLRERILGHRPGLKFIFISGYTDGLTEHFADDSTIEFLGKPFSAEALAIKAREMLDRQVSSAE